MKSAWDWKLLRRTANHAGIVVFAAGLAHGVLGKGDILSSLVLTAIGTSIIGFSIMRRFTMSDIVLVALAGALPLIFWMIIGLYINR
ncbi:MAG: hypothetical protein OD817_03285 [Gammaproteobacteria bacterium]